jgi:glyoxylase-like metal-dependent hydrolase (beta-lactamase superfamily II)/ferredoxin
MANLAKAVPENAPGEFFVDSTCIDCDTCRQVAPLTFGEAPETAFVKVQPSSAKERHQAMQALVCCPTGSIGTHMHHSAKEVINKFPLPIEGDVFYCGFNSPKSFGGNSYFIQRSDGNWLVDSPKFLPQLTRSMEKLGGIAGIFLTHRDDVADAEKYARHFGATRVIHRLELESQPGAERVLDGAQPIELAHDLLAIPTPGHTEGHCVLLYDQRFLFTGDHLHYDRHSQQLAAYHDFCWHSWPQQIESLRLLLKYSFEWVLPGHGQRVHLPALEMHRQLERLVRAISPTH